jgi:hypothetical protein
MSRAMFLSMEEADVINKCNAEGVGISAIERLPGTGTRLVCMSVDGAERMRTKLKSKVMKIEAKRHRIRPSRPLW